MPEDMNDTENLGELLKIRRDKLHCIAGGRPGSLPDYEI